MLGTCYVAPRRGVAVTTIFNMSCNGWSDAEADVPLTYHFTAHRDTGETYALGAESVNATIKVKGYICCELASLP
jgi:hypothetical protein